MQGKEAKDETARLRDNGTSNLKNRQTTVYRSLVPYTHMAHGRLSCGRVVLPLLPVLYSDAMVDIVANCKAVMERIRVASDKSGRDPESVKLMAATKTQGARKVRAAVDAGVRFLGENYVQEAQRKYAELGDLAEWHLIGHLQRNKAKIAVDLFAVIQSLDNVALARILDREGGKRNRDVRALIEVNLAGEESKTGVSVADVIPLLKEVAQLQWLKIEGLMTIPPIGQDPEASRPYFRELRQLRDTVNDLALTDANLVELSMGMTHDYPVAIEEGATMIRVGTALFGQRPPRQ